MGLGWSKSRRPRCGRALDILTVIAQSGPNHPTVHTSERQLNLYRLLVENSLGLMCIHDLDGVLLSVNPAVAQSLGYPPGEGRGRNLREFLATSVQHLFDGYLRRIRDKGTDSGLMRLTAKDGTERIWYYRNILHLEAGEPPSVLGHALDITQRIRAEQSLKEAQRALQKARDELAARVVERTAELNETNQRLRAEIEQRRRMEEDLLRVRKLESLGVLAGGIAHDFNNFLTIVQCNLELAEMQADSGEPVHEILEQTALACRRATALASQLLTFGKGGAPVRRTAGVAPLIRDAAALVCAGSRVSLKLDIADDLWSAEIDAEQISQALHNILLNARQAMPEGGVIEVRAWNEVEDGCSGILAAGNYVGISVRDHGCGIQPDVVARIFDPYFTTKQTGSGLGLATAHAIVAKHDGRISVTSESGQGATFHMYLPASATSASLEAASAPVLQDGSGRILVMDDEEALRTLLARMLKRLGYEVQCASHGAEAIAFYEMAKASGHGFDAVLLDLTVPGGMGGVEAAAKLREIDPSVRLIVSSGYADAPVMCRHREYGFDDLVRKPWTAAQISEVVGRVLGQPLSRG